MLVKISVYFDIDGNPSPEVLKEFLKDLQEYVTMFLQDENAADILNEARESESFPRIIDIVDYKDMMKRILKPNPQVLEEPKRTKVIRKIPSKAKKN